MESKSWKRKQVLALCAVMALGCSVGTVGAKDYTTPMTGDATTDTEYADVVSSTTSATTYTFAEDNTISVSGGTPLEFTSSLSGETFKATTAMTTINSTAGSTMTVNPGTNTLSLHVTAEGDAIGAGILQTSAQQAISIKPGNKTEIKVSGAKGNTQKSYGIWRAVTDINSKAVNILNRTGDASRISITVDNKNGGYGIAISSPEGLTLTDEQKNLSNSSQLILGYTTVPVAVDIKVSENKNATNVLEESAGMYCNVGGGTISVFGTVDLDVEGHGILLAPADGVTRSPTITVTKGGKINVHPDKDGAERYAIYNAKGTLNYAAGNTGVAVKNVTQIDGDLYLGNGTTTKLALYGSESYLSGAIKEDGTPSTVELTFANGATWHNVATNTANLGIAANVTKLSGVAGLLHQTKDSGDVTIARFNSALFNIAYDHDATDPTKILGGDVTITTAGSGNKINVFTDYDDNMSTEAIRENVLNALAQKVYYTNYTTGETNLTGQVSIAEGLTTASTTKYFADMSFDDTTGQGYLAEDTEVKTLTVAEKQTQTEFSDFLSTNPLYITPYIEAGIYKDGVFNFTEDTKFTFDDSLPTVTGGSWLTRTMRTGIVCENTMDPVIIDLNGHNLDISQTTSSVQSTIMSIGNDSLVEINNPGKINIDVKSSGTTITGGLFAIWGGKLFIHNGGENQDQKVVTIRASSNSSTNCAAIKTMNEVSGAHSWIKIDGLVDIQADTTNGVGCAEGLSSVASTIEVGGGKIIMTASGENPGVNFGGGAANNAIRAYGEFVSGNTGIVNVNVIKDEDTATGTAIAAGNNPVQISGNFSTVGGMGTKGNINVGLNTEDSYWVGNYNYGSGWGVTPTTEGLLRLFMGNKAKWYGYSKYATNLVMDSGAEWTGYSQNWAVKATVKNGAIIHAYDKDSQLKSLTGGDSEASAGILDMTQSDFGIVTENYSGYMKAFYAHDEEDPTTINGGFINIISAAEGSDITLLTDNTGFDVHDEDKTVEVIGNLAKKLTYRGAIVKEGAEAENNLSGHVGIAEGLTSSSAVIKLGDVTFSEEDGVGSYETGTLHTPSADIIYGDNETAMMKGAKAAMAGAALVWCTENNDLMKRMGDLRMNPGETGIWAKYYGGKNTFDSQNTDISVRYNAVQVGFDREVGLGWKMGVALSHNTGDASLGNGDADLKSTSIGVYGTWQHKNGSYADIIFKASKMDNEYDVFNTYGHKLHGDYDVWGTSFSAEIGKRFTYENGLTVDPNIEFTYGNIEGKTYDAKSDYSGGKALHVDQDRFSSFIGRLGVKVGKTTKRANYYAKLALAHEFLGDFNTTFSADNEPTGKTHLEFAGTWLEVRLGLNAKLSDRSNFYADVEKTFGGDIKETWRLDAGFRLSF